MASTTPKTIVISDTDPVQYERVANNVAITPGDLIERTGGAVALHSTAGGNAAALFAVENPYSDDNTVAAIDDAYGTADTVRFIAGRPGDQVYGWLTVGGSVNDGDYLESAGSLGALQIYAAGTALAPRRVVAQALESVDNGAGGAKARLRVEIV